MVTARTLVIATIVACVALPGCAGCGHDEKRPVAVHPVAKEAPAPPEMLDSPRHLQEATAAAVAFAQKKYAGKLDVAHPRAEFLGGHAMAVPGEHAGKLMAKDAPVGTWKVYLKALKVAAIIDTKAQPEPTAEPGSGASEEAAIATRVFYVHPDLTVVETQGLPSLLVGAAPLQANAQP